MNEMQQEAADMVAFAGLERWQSPDAFDHALGFVVQALQVVRETRSRLPDESVD